MNYFGRLKRWTKARIKRITATTSKTAIATLSAAILILVFSVIVFKSARSFCWEHPGILIVAFAVAGEVICDWNRKKNIKERLKKFFGILLVAGLLLEIAEAIESDKKASQAILSAALAETNAAASYERAASAEKEAGQAIERAALVESNNIALRLQIQPRTITLPQITNFMALTKFIGKIPIKIVIGTQGEDAENFAHQMRDMFTQAQFPIDSSAGFWGITRDSSIVISKGIDSTNKSFPVMFIFNDPKEPINTFVKHSVLIYNGLPFAPETSPKRVFEAIEWCFGEIGIELEWINKPDWVQPGEFEIYIPPKNN